MTLSVILFITYLPFLARIKIPDNLIAIAGITPALATLVICLLTVISVAEVIKANKENFKSNLQRDARDSFEKKFSLLLQEHNNYLDKLINSENKLYDTSYLQKCSGYESYAVIRGSAKFITINGKRFASTMGTPW